jgi:DNA repair protein RecO (recombination protein O)
MADRPRTYKTEGVVLRRRNIGEADSIFTVFSEDLGKFEAVARGVRKARSHMRGHLEPLTRSRFLVARGRSLDVFTQAETVTSYRAIRDDLDRSAEALYCAELVDRLTAEHQEQRDVYFLLLDALDALEIGHPLYVTRLFEVRLLAALGYELQLDHCATCGARLEEEEQLIAPVAGGLVCPDCRAGAGGGRMVSPRVIKVLRFARQAPMEHFAGLRIDPDLARQLQLALAGVIRGVLEGEVNAGRFVDQVARLAPSRSLTRADVQ